MPDSSFSPPLQAFLVVLYMVSVVWAAGVVWKCGIIESLLLPVTAAVQESSLC